MADKVTACILIIGNEVLSGRTQDANLNFLAGELNTLGIQVGEARVIPDVEQTIIETLNYARDTYDYVFTTGGIGPTHDDITSACVAKAMGYDFAHHPDAVKMLQSHYKPEDLNEARLRMAQTPVGASLIENPISKAPGYQIENVFVLAGVPRIARAMFDNLKSRLVGGAPVLSTTVSSDLGEGVIAQPLGDIQTLYPDIDIGSYPYFKDGQLGVSLVLRSTKPEQNEECAGAIKEMIESLDGNIIFSL
ncbi:Molybdopterin binding domain-containing protein [Candidatus Terasakiella magnetica]|uniref:Molybdopterin binding domain-containing protein n=1 Tax=Candidatus Terasakiella magnetica TaxID=1867952 RepID=A0A1C3RE29_9PROT|nr:molybdopterin-binding protein [Candidatus Terasakiella magnetica]SCA55515.1 Molybdopterin binding domain-containing protein [Candidatus Terasakiella magnetica]